MSSLVPRAFALLSLALCRALTLALALAIAIGCAPEAGDEARTLIEEARFGLGTYGELTGFGDNPGDLRAYQYIPENVPANAPLVLAFHACSQTAQDYRKAGWEQLADQLKFYVLYPEQQTGNNPARCFNWAGEYSDPTNLRRGEGENQSIKQMIDKMKADRSIDPRRVFAAGHSGGAAQVALMMATWPDVFAGGAMIAGIAYNCTTTFNQVSTCLSPGIDRSAAEWGDRARAGHAGFSGPWPRISIWHGTADTTVNPMNLTELLEQWTNVHGIDLSPDATGTVDGATHKQHKNAGGQTLVETYEIPSMGHGTPVVPADGCGQAGAYFLDAGICSARRIGEFFGLGGTVDPGDTEPPAVNVTGPANSATVNGTVNITVTASDNVGVARVEISINGQLKSTVTAAPYRFSWNTSTEANGSYAIRAVAFDAAGNSSTDDDTRVEVTGGVSDTTPPAVNVVAPVSGANISGTVSIRVDATDNLGVQRVEVLIDGSVAGQLTASPYTYSWDTSAVASGTHRIGARAVDAAGNETTDDDTSVTVQMAGDTTAPTVNITDPLTGATLAGVVTVKAEASDDTGVSFVLLFMDDELLGSDYRAPYEFLWDTAVYAEGAHTLSTRAFDAAGNVGIDADTMITLTRAGPAPDAGGNNGGSPAGPQTLAVGKSYWGCTAAPGGAGQGDLALLALLALGIVWRRRADRRWIAALCLATSLGCGGDPIFVVLDGDGGVSGPVTGADGGTGPTLNLGSASQIMAYLEGKTLVMEGASIPTHPNGFDENVNYGQATQCYHYVTMRPQAGRFQVVSQLGTLKNAPNTGDHGTCDHDAVANELTFDSTAVLMENVRDNGACFDFTITFPGFGQEGRGKISPDGSTLTLELFFKDQATGHRCSSGEVGAATVTLSGASFTGDARQTYAIRREN
ncbi:MAG: PHB depolymerase family esterase [Deltaproteobacteria bacterium]|nr:PHB depolymerase family esterase [Deltaproteobacteria bacterium]